MWIVAQQLEKFIKVMPPDSRIIALSPPPPSNLHRPHALHFSLNNSLLNIYTLFTSTLLFSLPNIFPFPCPSPSSKQLRPPIPPSLPRPILKQNYEECRIMTIVVHKD